MKIYGSFKGSGAALYLCLGFVPDSITLYNTSNSGGPKNLHWNRSFIKSAHGTYFNTFGIYSAAGTEARVAATYGITPYYGGETLDNNSTTYFLADPAPNKIDKGSQGTITKFTIDSAANKTGHVDKYMNVTYPGCGIGSQIYIDGQFYTITQFTNYGETATYITLDRVTGITAGLVTYVSGQYTHIPYTYFAAPIPPKVSPAGILLGDVTVNVSTEDIVFVAELDD